jgi:hypothetical protein
MQEQFARLLTFGERAGWTCEELRRYLGLPRRKV